MHELESLPPSDHTALEDSGVPWTFGDMGKAIGLLVLGLLVVSIGALVIADSLVDLRAEEDSRAPVTCLLSICGTRIAVDLDLQDIPTSLMVVLASSLVLEALFLGTVFYFAVRKYRLPWSRLGLAWPRVGGWFLPLGLFFGALAIVWVYFGLLSLVGVDTDADLPDAVFDNLGPVVVIAILSLMFAPVMEEVFFRGFIFGGLRRHWGLVGAALGSGVLFGITHLGNPGTFYVVPPISLVGALFAWGYAYSGSLYPSMGAHFLFNLFSLGIGLATS